MTNILVVALSSLISFVSALLIDRALLTIRLRTDAGLIGPALSGAVALELLFVAILLGTSWLVAVRLKPPRWMAIALIIIAAMIIAAYPLAVADIPYLSRFLARAIMTVPMPAGEPGTLSSIQACAILFSAIRSLFRPSSMHAA